MDSLMFVQFPHPGSEHSPTGSAMPWNRGEHRRKFLKASGRYIADGSVCAGSATFWGEWEPPSRVVETFHGRAIGEPKWLHEPILEVPRHRGLLQNTDPLVFGARFLYSNCRQARNRKLRELAPGSIVLFGSKVQSAFVLDTVLVVDNDSQWFTPGSAGGIACEAWIRSVVFDPLDKSTRSAGASYRAYFGRPYADSPDQPFSFVPCVPYAAGASAFARPVINLDRRLIEPNLAMGAKATPATADELLHVWHTVVDQVQSAGLALGVYFEPPAAESSSP